MQTLGRKSILLYNRIHKINYLTEASGQSGSIIHLHDFPFRSVNLVKGISVSVRLRNRTFGITKGEIESFKSTKRVK